MVVSYKFLVEIYEVMKWFLVIVAFSSFLLCKGEILGWNVKR